MTGPWQQRLHHELSGTGPAAVEMVAAQWELASHLLSLVSVSLAESASSPGLVRVGRETGRAVSDAFTRSAEAVNRKAEELREGGQAFLVASRAMRQAEARRDALGAQGPPPTAPTFGPGPRDEADVRKQAEYDTSAAAWQADFERREREARQASEEMAAAFQRSSAILRRIHGETGSARARSGSSGDPAVSSAGATRAGGPSGGSGAAVSATGTATGTGAGAGVGGSGSGGTLGAVAHAPGAPGSDGSPATAYGVPQGSGSGASVTPGPVVTAPPGAAAVSSTGAGVALGGLALGGLAAGAAGGVRAALAGGAAAGRGAATTAAATAARNVRPIGAGSSRGAAPILGRPGTMTGAAPANTSPGRGAPGVGAPAGSRVGAGATTGAPAGGGSRASRRQDRRAAPAGYGEEWELDEDEAGPQVIA